MMPDFTKQQYRVGADLLKELLPKARAMVSDMRFEARSAIGKATMPHLRQDNLKAVMIYSPPTGGWIADVVCKKTPPGIANVFGTPVGEPLASREEAYDSAIRCLALILAMEAQHLEVKDPVFSYYDVTFTLDALLLNHMSKMGASYSSAEHAYQRLGEVTKQLFPDGYKYKELEIMSEDRRRYLGSILHMAALTNILRYPPLIPRGPNTTRH